MRRKEFVIFFLLFFSVSIFGEGLKIKGKVTDKNGEALLGANVMIMDLSIGAATDLDGNYIFDVPSANVNGQEVKLSASYIGFKQNTTTIVLRGNTLEVNFVLEEDVFKSEEIVVTGIASITSKAIADVAVSRIDASDLTAKHLYQGVNQLIAGKVAGVQMKQPSGTIGGGFRFFVRGGGGLNGNQQPVIYVDGVRINSSTVEAFSTGGQQMSVLANLNPNDIEKMEVLKGPAAAATYGTSGANGVIIITTKQGKISGKENFNVNYKFNYGFHEQSFKYDKDIYENADLIDDQFKDGPLREHTLGFSGGSSSLRYYTSFSRREEDGILDKNDMQRTSARFNLTALPSEKFQFKFNASYVDNVINTINNDNNLFSFLEQTMTYNPPWANADREAISMITNNTKNNQFIGSMGLNIKPIEKLEFNATVGVDQMDWTQEQIYPYGYKYNNDTTGSKGVFDFNNRLLTFDANMAYSYNLLEDLIVKSIIGLQATDRRYKSLIVEYKNFSSDQFPTIEAAADLERKEERLTHERTAGIFMDHQLNYKNTYMVSLALRKDYASSIGVDAPSIVYPKASGAVRLDKITSLPSFVNMLKFRIAYGENGILPGSRDGIPTMWRGKTGPNGGYVELSSIGNKNIKPERLKEFETGLDFELFNKVSVEFTYYYQTAENSIVEKNNSVSSGIGDFSSPYNLGSVKNYGFETSIQYSPLRTQEYSLNFNLIINYQNNEVTDLGGTSDIYDPWRVNVIKPGFAKHEFFIKPVLGAQFDENGRWTGNAILGDNEESLGNPIPKHTGSLSINFTFLKDFNFNALLEWGVGHKIYNFTKSYLAIDGGSVEFNKFYPQFVELDNAKDYSNPLYKELAEKLVKMDYRYNGNFIEDADFLAVREISLSYNATDMFNKFSTDNLFKSFVVGISTRNPFRWSKYTFGDYEANAEGSRGLTRGMDFFTLQTPRTFNFWISLGV